MYFCIVNYEVRITRSNYAIRNTQYGPVFKACPLLSIKRAYLFHSFRQIKPINRPYIED